MLKIVRKELTVRRRGSLQKGDEKGIGGGPHSLFSLTNSLTVLYDRKSGVS